MKGKILIINPGSTSTKIGFYEDGQQRFETNLTHSAEEIAKYESVMHQGGMRRDAIVNFLSENGVALESIDLIMARGGLITPIQAGVYQVTEEMREALIAGRDGVHACNLSALIADDMAADITKLRAEKGIEGVCKAYIADAPTSDEMLPELKLSGHPAFQRRAAFHTLNSRAMVRRYARSVGKTNKDVTVIVAHMGGGTSVSLHRNGYVIDVNDALGGDGPMSPERAGSVPAFPLVEMCFSGKYTKAEIKKMLVGKGGAVGHLGTNDFRDVVAGAEKGDPAYAEFLKAFCISVAKYIGAMACVVGGKVDAIVLTGGIAHGKVITSQITEMVQFIAPVEVYPGENELESLAENGYGVLAGEFEVKTYSNKLQ
jgi:butyrate kinase